MPNLNYVLSILATTIFALVTLSTQAEKHKTASAPSPVQDTSKEQDPGCDECVGELTSDCQKEVFGDLNLFYEIYYALKKDNRNQFGNDFFYYENISSLSRHCCEKLVHTGRRCSRVILRCYLAEPEIGTEAKKELGKRELAVWDHCYAIYGSHDEEVKKLLRK